MANRLQLDPNVFVPLARLFCILALFTTMTRPEYLRSGPEASNLASRIEKKIPCIEYDVGV